jgi:hypothetical protein
MYYAGKKKGGGVVMCDKEKKIKREIHVWCYITATIIKIKMIINVY